MILQDTWEIAIFKINDINLCDKNSVSPFAISTISQFLKKLF